MRPNEPVMMHSSRQAFLAGMLLRQGSLAGMLLRQASLAGMLLPS